MSGPFFFGSLALSPSAGRLKCSPPFVGWEIFFNSGSAVGRRSRKPWKRAFVCNCWRFRPSNLIGMSAMTQKPCFTSYKLRSVPTRRLCYLKVWGKKMLDNNMCVVICKTCHPHVVRLGGSFLFIICCFEEQKSMLIENTPQKAWTLTKLPSMPCQKISCGAVYDNNLNMSFVGRALGFVGCSHQRMGSYPSAGGVWATLWSHRECQSLALVCLSSGGLRRGGSGGKRGLQATKSVHACQHPWAAGITQVKITNGCHCRAKNLWL